MNLRCSKIVCIGQNYPAHARELNFAPPPRPVLFLKPPSSLIADGDVIEAPLELGRVDHEVELALIMGKRARNVSEEDALSYISMVAVFNDITARDIQSGSSELRPAMGALQRPRYLCPHVGAGSALFRDGHTPAGTRAPCKRRGVPARTYGDMLFSPEQLISYITAYMTLEEGDIIATGTPEGVSGLNDGDIVEASIPGVGKVTNRVRRV